MPSPLLRDKIIVAERLIQELELMRRLSFRKYQRRELRDRFVEVVSPGGHVGIVADEIFFTLVGVRSRWVDRGQWCIPGQMWASIRGSLGIPAPAVEPEPFEVRKRKSKSKPQITSKSPRQKLLDLLESPSDAEYQVPLSL